MNLITGSNGDTPVRLRGSIGSETLSPVSGLQLSRLQHTVVTNTSFYRMITMGIPIPAKVKDIIKTGMMAS